MILLIVMMIYTLLTHINTCLMTEFSVVVTSDLVLEVTKESSLLLGSVTLVIDNPFLIFEELSIFYEDLMNLGGTVLTRGS